jgi:branched-chain amino acid transport system permease protein
LEALIQMALSILSLGGLYALLALGLALVFSVMGLANFAYGELIMLTGYGVLLLTGGGVPFAAAVPITVALVALVSVLMERVAFRPVRGASGATLLVTSFALSAIIQNLVSLLVGPRARGLPIPDALGRVVRIGEIRVVPLEMVTVIVSGVVLLLLTIFLVRTTVGIELRAAAEDFGMARMLGINANRVVATAFALSGLLGSIAGLLWLARTANVAPQSGFSPLLIAFVAAVFGGLGNLKGAAVGGFALAGLTVTFQAILPSEVAGLRNAFAYTVVILLLLLRPEGLLARRRAESL